MDMMYVPENRFVQEVKINGYLNERTIYLNTEINDDVEIMINRMFEKIVERDEREGKPIEERAPIKLKISSPGGSVYATLSIISTIETLKQKGYKIHGYAYGLCMSGAFKIFISCSKRYTQRYTRFMYHQVSSYEMDRISVESSKRRAKDLEEMWKKCEEVILKYTNITQEQLDIITREDRDVYLWTEEAINLNVADEIF